MADPNSRPIRYVVFHQPGPKWQHVQHYLKLHEQGKLELGGPFLLQDAV